MTYILAIDQSTSATKAVLFDAAGQVVDRAAREHRQIYPQPGRVEHDAEEIWQNVLAVIGEIADRQREKVASAVGLAIANQRETVVVFDRRSGRPVSNAIVWQCRRGEPVCDELRRAGHEELVERKTGLKLDPYFSASKLMSLGREQPELGAQWRDGGALIGTMDAYLIHRLTRGEVFATDATNASRTLVYDIDAVQWDAELCGLFGVPQRALPEVRESFARFGETDAEGRLPRKLPICGVMGDSQASLFAQRCYEPGMAKATFGSGTSIMLTVGEARPAVARGAVTALAWVCAGRPTYAYEGLVNYSSATIAWLKDQLGLIDDVADTERMAIEAGSNGGVYLVPAFAGLSAPYWKPEARAAIVNMTSHTRKDHIVRAALESIAFQIRDVLEMMHKDAGVAPRVLHVDGGPTRNKFLMQFTADMTGAELIVSDVAESSALGAAMAGMLGLGVVESMSEFAAVERRGTIYGRRMESATVTQALDGWRRAVQRVTWDGDSTTG